MRTQFATPLLAARLGGLLFALLALLAARPAAQAPVPGDYPHLTLADGSGAAVPGPGGPFDNSHVFPAVAGQSFEAHVSYASPGQPNTNVLWALFVSTGKTPLPTNITPPPLLTMPPMVLMLPPLPTLDAAGQASLPLFVPAGLASLPVAYVQALTWDTTGSPALRLSNGLTVQVALPSLEVGFGWVRGKQASTDPTLLRDTGRIDLPSTMLPMLKPIGTVTAPVAVADPDLYFDNYRFLPIVHNRGDEPVNPRARPFTRITGVLDGTTDTITVEDTSYFPRSGRLLISYQGSNLWAKKTGGGFTPPKVEVVRYDGLTKTSFLNCQRNQLGSSGTTTFPHAPGEMVVGDFTLATTSGARARTRISLDADNPDLPHVVIPAYTYDAGPDVGQKTVDLDLYMYETEVNKVQGFVLYDRVSRTWRIIPGSEKNTAQGRWEPMISVAPDGRSFVAQLRVKGDGFGWDWLPNQLWVIRTDGLSWPASGGQSWNITYEVGPDPTSNNDFNIRARRVIMPAVAIVGPDPENYVLYAGLAHKWKQVTGIAGVTNVGQEGEWVSEELIVRDLIECALVPPGSTKAPPSMPRPWINSDLPKTGLNNPVVRFDPEFLPTPDNKWLLVTGGGGNAAEKEEDAYLVRNISVDASGTVHRVLVNLSGFGNSSGGKHQLRPFTEGGHGRGRRAAFSPGLTRVAWLAYANDTQRDWIDIALTTGATYGSLLNTYETGYGTGVFRENSGALATDRVVCGVRWLDENRLIFMQGKAPYDDPTAFSAANAVQMDLFLYDVGKDLMTNLSRTDGSATGFLSLGKVVPAGFFAAADGSFAYLLRAGGISNVGGSPLPVGTKVLNVVGVDASSASLFPVTGTEFSPGALVADLTIPSAELLAPVETVAPARVVEGTGVQDGLIYFAAHVVNGNGSDEIVGLDRAEPFVAFKATASAQAGVHVSNILPDPWGGKLAFARTGGTDPFGGTQHPFLVDLDNFLYERDLLPTWVAGGTAVGRLMDGSFHFIPPSGSAGEALVLSFGVGALPTGIALQATPAYYALGAVSDPLAEPIPVLIPLVDTGLLGTDYRFYLPSAGLALPDSPK